MFHTAGLPGPAVGITIYDIADRASVSIATVSRVFNGHPRVSDGTREKVFEVAQELGYQPHVSAQSLARRKTHVVSAVVPVMTNFFYMEVLRGIQDALHDTDFDLLIYAAPSPDEVEGQLRRAAQRGRADALLLLSTPLADGDARRLRKARQPVLLLDAFHPDFDSVTVDNVKGGYLATKHLLDLGRRRISHLTVTPEPPPATQRREGYEQALREAGIEPDPALVVGSPRRPFGFVEEAGYEAARQVLEADLGADAFFVASDAQAFGALRALKEASVRVPEDVAVVGFDGVTPSRHLGLTTLRQPMYEMGRLAIDKLLRRIEEPGHPTSHTVFAPRLVARATTAAAQAAASAA